jgi:hypothetical protein
MVAAGVGAQVGVTLYVIGEGRYEAAPPFDNAVVDDSKLVWFHAQNLSNYEELAQSLMKQNGGRTWLTEYSRAGDLATSGTQICGLSGTPYYSGQSLADLYLGQCPCNAGAASPLVFSQGDASDDALSALAVQPEASAGSPAFEASVPPSAPACTGDDVQVALVGLSTANVWVTRLRAVIPVNALSEHDLLLQAASVQTPVSNQHVTNTYDDPSYSPCGSQGSCAASDARGSSGWLEGGALCLAAAAGLRRLKRRVSGTSSQK